MREFVHKCVRECVRKCVREFVGECMRCCVYVCADKRVCARTFARAPLLSTFYVRR